MITHRTVVFAMFTHIITLLFVVVEVSPYVLDKRTHARTSFYNRCFIWKTVLTIRGANIVSWPTGESPVTNKHQWNLGPRLLSLILILHFSDSSLINRVLIWNHTVHL